MELLCQFRVDCTISPQNSITARHFIGLSQLPLQVTQLYWDPRICSIISLESICILLSLVDYVSVELLKTYRMKANEHAKTWAIRHTLNLVGGEKITKNWSDVVWLSNRFSFQHPLHSSQPSNSKGSGCPLWASMGTAWSCYTYMWAKHPYM